MQFSSFRDLSVQISSLHGRHTTISPLLQSIMHKSDASPAVVEQTFDPHSIDHFAANHNALLPRFSSEKHSRSIGKLRTRGQTLHSKTTYSTGLRHIFKLILRPNPHFASPTGRRNPGFAVCGECKSLPLSTYPTNRTCSYATDPRRSANLTGSGLWSSESPGAKSNKRSITAVTYHTRFLSFRLHRCTKHTKRTPNYSSLSQSTF